MRKSEVIVVGAGIAGLTSAAILSKQGLSVTLIESHTQAGGCAGTFKRKDYIFDVGATQVAGLEKGGIHERIFRHLKWPVPEATILNPACIVDLGDGLDPIHIWHDSEKWEKERKKQSSNKPPTNQTTNQPTNQPTNKPKLPTKPPANKSQSPTKFDPDSGLGDPG